jgi:hypothetical protein
MRTPSGAIGGMDAEHCRETLSELDIGRILVPRDAFSAHGMLRTDAHQKRSLTRITRLLDDAG